MRGMLLGAWMLGVVSLWMEAACFPLLAANKTAESEKSTGGYLLRYRFQKNEVLNYQVDHETTMVTTTPQYSERVTNEVRSRKNHRVVGLDSDGNATLELVIEQAEMSAQFGEAEPLCFDSQNPENCPKVYQHMRAVIGQPLARVQVSPQGKLLETRPQLPHDVLAKANLVKPDGTLTDEASQNFLIEFPEKELQVGEGWTNTFKVKVGVGRSLTQFVTLQRSYELVKVEGDLATIELRTGLITPTRDGMILAQLIQMTPKGTIVFDMERGRLVSRTLTIDKTEVGVIGGGGSMQAKSKRVERWIDPKAEAKVQTDENKQAAK